MTTTNKSIYELNQEAKTNLTWEDLPVGTHVKIMCYARDFNFFFGETGIVVNNGGQRGSLGITVKFDKPRHFEGGYVQACFNFNPDDLAVLGESKVCPTCGRGNK